jgi:hypothetical protein
VKIKWKEDPAYEIIRQAIKMDPYCQSVVKESTYEVYMKGSGKINHIPGLINKMSNGELENFKGKFCLD